MIQTRFLLVAPGGCTAYNNHNEEHEMNFLESEGLLKTEQNPGCIVRAGDASSSCPAGCTGYKIPGRER